MEFGLPTTTTSSVYQPYTATNYKTTQSVKNVDYGSLLTTTQDYPATSYSKIETPTYTTGETYTTSEYQATTPTTTTAEYTATNYDTTPAFTTTSDYQVTDYTTSIPEITTQEYTTTAY